MAWCSATDTVQRQNNKTIQSTDLAKSFGVTSLPRAFQRQTKSGERETVDERNIPIFILSIWNFFRSHHTLTHTKQAEAWSTYDSIVWNLDWKRGPYSERAVGKVWSALAKSLNYKNPINKSSVGLVSASVFGARSVNTESPPYDSRPIDVDWRWWQTIRSECVPICASINGSRTMQSRRTS